VRSSQKTAEVIRYATVRAVTSRDPNGGSLFSFLQPDSIRMRDAVLHVTSLHFSSNPFQRLFECSNSVPTSTDRLCVTYTSLSWMGILSKLCCSML
jgi:hypothetical protein